MPQVWRQGGHWGKEAQRPLEVSDVQTPFTSAPCRQRRGLRPPFLLRVLALVLSGRRLSGEGMTLPPDVARLRHKWIRERSHAWTELPLRTVLVAFLDTFLAEHGWVRQMDLEERFTDQGVSVKVPLGITGDRDAAAKVFLQRDGVPIIRIGATRDSDGERFEVALPFAEANEIPDVTRDRLLGDAKNALETLERLL